MMYVPMQADDINGLRVGDRVRIAPPFQDVGDDEFTRVVIEARED